MKTFHRSTGRKLLTAVLISAVIIAVFVMLQLAAHTPQTTTTMEVYADYPVYASVSDSVSASDIIITGVPLNSREVIEYPRIDFETGTEESNPQRGLTWENIDIEAMSVPHIVGSSGFRVCWVWGEPWGMMVGCEEDNRRCPAACTRV